MLFPQTPGFGGSSSSGTTLNLSPSIGSDGPRHYAAGYISTASSGAHHHLDQTTGSHGRDSNGLSEDQDDWIQSPLHPSRMRSGGAGTGSLNSYRGGGGGLFAPKESMVAIRPSRNSGLFGSSNRLANSAKAKGMNDAMEDDAPPRESLLDEDNFGSKMISQDSSSHHRSLASSLVTTPLRPDVHSSTDHHQLDHSQSSSSTGYRIFVFGFTPSQQSFVINHFAQIGEFLCPAEPSTEGGNWAIITYKHCPAAQRAVRKNGDILGGIIMIGCRWVDEPQGGLRETTEDRRSGGEPRKLGAGPGSRTGLARTSSMIISRPLRTYDSSEAFAHSSDQTAHKSWMSSVGQPNPSVFKDQDENSAPGRSSYVNRALDLVFGW